jgi:tetratricopeptide (TPR) repeat protein
VKVREHTSNAVARAAEQTMRQVDTRVQEVQQTLAAQHAQEVAGLRAANRATLRTVILLVLAGLVALAALGIMLWRRLTRRLTSLPVMVEPALPVGLPAVEPATGRLLGAVDHLEKRLEELEASTRPAKSLPALGAGDQVSLLLGKGEAHMALEQFAAALECFTEAARLDPNSAEAAVRRGATLEKLERLDEAVAAYDQAIALDDKFLMAYLRKGGLYNRLDRPTEALACYERALAARSAANAVN